MIYSNNSPHNGKFSAFKQPVTTIKSLPQALLCLCPRLTDVLIGTGLITESCHAWMLSLGTAWGLHHCRLQEFLGQSRKINLKSDFESVLVQKPLCGFGILKYFTAVNAGLVFRAGEALSKEHQKSQLTQK